MASHSVVLVSEDNSINFGSQIATQLHPGDVVILSGPLGAGKTVLARGIAQGLHVCGPVSSPTYVLSRFHPPAHPGGVGMIHVDLYRLIGTGLDLSAQLDSLDLESELDHAVVVIEWGEGIVENLSSRYLQITLHRDMRTNYRHAHWNWHHNG